MAEKYVGDISVSLNEVHWRIPNFYNLPQKPDTTIESPLFRYADRYWKMFVHPNGESWDSSVGWFGMEAICNNSCLDIEIFIVKFGITGDCNENQVSSRGEFYGKGTFFCNTIIRHSVLESLKDDLAPGGILDLFFIIENENDSTSIDESIFHYVDYSLMRVKTKVGKNKPKQRHDDTCMKAQLQKEIDPSLNSDDSDSDSYVSLKTELPSSDEVESQLEGIMKLQQDFKEILLNGNVSDIILKVEDQEFKSHRSILAARSPVFLAMMMHDTKEKATGVVDLQDVDPNTFPNFLNYLYTGSMENVTSKNAHKLYVTSDMYQVKELKDVCLDNMMNNISIENFVMFSLYLSNMMRKT